MLETFTVETFAPRLGEIFQLDAEGVPLELELVEAEAVGGALAEGRRAPFSIVFRGPPDPVLPQRVYPMTHDTLGAFDLFLVPIGPEPGAPPPAPMRYEAVFG